LFQKECDIFFHLATADRALSRISSAPSFSRI
jgi:hypothetical protein